MPRTYDTLYRQWLVLSRIPRFPRRITTPELKVVLSSEGYDIHVRTIQRDLEKLSIAFPLSCDIDGRKNLWYWQESARIQDLPNMDIVTALAFGMAESYLHNILPQTTLDLLKPYFERANEVLATCNQSRLHSWPDKVAVISRGPELVIKAVNRPFDSTNNLRRLIERQASSCDLYSSE